MKSLQRIRFLIWKELLELKGDTRLLGLIIVAPIIQLFMLGYAATTDILDVPIVVADADRTAASRDLIQRFDASPNFTVVALLTGPDDVDPYLDGGHAGMALTIPPGYADSLSAGRPQAVQIIADGSDANSATVALGYATNLIAAYAQDLAAAHMPPDASPSGGIEPRIRVWFNPRLESRDFMIPGVVALLLLVITANLSSMGIVREKELGTLEQLNVTPLHRSELIIGKLLPYALVGMIDVLLVIAVALFWFEIPLRGSFWLLCALTLLYLLSTLGLGLFVSTISSTQQQAMMTTIFFFLTPMIYLSGFIFPIENMPAAIQLLTYLVPLRYFLVIVRAIFLKGVGLEAMWPEVLGLTAWGVGILLLAIARSTKRAA
jgi:ABC-2 type transport system permease protein